MNERRFSLVPAEIAEEVTTEIPFWEKVHSDHDLAEDEFDWLLAYIQRNNAEAVACQNAAAAHTARAKRCTAKGEAIMAEIAERLRLYASVKAGDRRNALVGRFRVQLRKLQPMLVLVDDFAEHYIKTPFVRETVKYDPDKKLIRQTLASGTPIKGAALVEQPDSVSVEDGVQ